VLKQSAPITRVYTLKEFAPLMIWLVDRRPARHFALALLAAGALASLAPGAASAQQTAPAKPIELTPDEIAEREGRKACKVAICAAFRNRKPGPDIACKVLKSWRKEQLDAMVSKARVSWPWGAVRCQTEVKLKREFLIKALVEPKYEAQIDKHEVVCEVDRGSEPKAEIKFDFSPKVLFEAGKATKATLNWGKIEAPTLVKGAMWTATATDNTFGVLQSIIVDDINDFTGAKCDEVKDAWAGQ
jgi:hypothetical protein